MPSCITARDKALFPSVSATGHCLIQATVRRKGLSQQDSGMVCMHVTVQGEPQIGTEVLLASLGAR